MPNKSLQKVERKKEKEVKEEINKLFCSLNECV